jgi:tetratricopeptide (TPR) repeat protein
LVTSVLGSGCLASVQVQLLQPAAVTLPADVNTLGLVDRSEIANANEGFLSAMEGMVTGESILGDREGAENVIAALSQTLKDSPRFDVRRVTADRSEVGSSLFDEQLPFLIVEHLCKNAEVDALVGLEYFDSDRKITHSSDTSTSTDSDGNERTKTTYKAQRETVVTATLRTYACDRALILDEVVQEPYEAYDHSSGSSRRAARRGLPSDQRAVNELGRRIGLDYGRRIAPSWIWEGRTYYADKHDLLKEAKFMVRDDRWADAAALWEQVLSDPDPKIAGRAAYNLALSREIEGDMDGAIAYADQAIDLFPNGHTRGYRSVLEERVYALAKLDEQLGPEN